MVLKGGFGVAYWDWELRYTRNSLSICPDHTARDLSKLRDVRCLLGYAILASRLTMSKWSIQVSSQVSLVLCRSGSARQL